MPDYMATIDGQEYKVHSEKPLSEKEMVDYASKVRTMAKPSASAPPKQKPGTLSPAPGTEVKNGRLVPVAPSRDVPPTLAQKRASMKQIAAHTAAEYGTSLPELKRLKGGAMRAGAKRLADIDKANQANGDAERDAAIQKQLRLSSQTGGGIGASPAPQVVQQSNAAAKVIAQHQPPSVTQRIGGALIGKEGAKRIPETLAEQKGVYGAIAKFDAGLLDSGPVIAGAAALGPALGMEGLIGRVFQAQMAGGLKDTLMDGKMRREDPMQWLTSLALQTAGLGLASHGDIAKARQSVGPVVQALRNLPKKDAAALAEQVHGEIQAKQAAKIADATKKAEEERHGQTATGRPVSGVGKRDVRKSDEGSHTQPTQSPNHGEAEVSPGKPVRKNVPSDVGDRTVANKPAGEATKPVEPPKAATPTETPRTAEKGVETAAAHGTLAPTEIGVKEGLQYKKEGITDAATGTGDTLKGTDVFDPEQAGPLTVWKDADGKHWVVNGHHRLELAQRAGRWAVIGPDGTLRDVPKRLQVNTIDAKDGWTLEKARARGALENIRDNKGSALDALDVVQQLGIRPEQFAQYGLSTKSSLAKSVAGLAKLDPQVLTRVKMGDLAPDAGAGIGSVEGLSPEAQRGAADEAAKHGFSSYAKGQRLAEQYLSDERSGLLAKENESGEEDLFGGEYNVSKSTRAIRVDIESEAGRKLLAKRSDLLKPTDAELRAGESIDKEGRKIEAQSMAESPAALRERLRLLLDQDEVRAEVARLAGEVGNGKLTKAEASDELVKALVVHVGKSVRTLADRSGISLFDKAGDVGQTKSEGEKVDAGRRTEQGESQEVLRGGEDRGAQGIGVQGDVEGRGLPETPRTRQAEKEVAPPVKATEPIRMKRGEKASEYVARKKAEAAQAAVDAPERPATAPESKPAPPKPPVRKPPATTPAAPEPKGKSNVNKGSVEVSVRGTDSGVRQPDAGAEGKGTANSVVARKTTVRPAGKEPAPEAEKKSGGSGISSKRVGQVVPEPAKATSADKVSPKPLDRQERKVPAGYHLVGETPGGAAIYRHGFDENDALVFKPGETKYVSTTWKGAKKIFAAQEGAAGVKVPEEMPKVPEEALVSKRPVSKRPASSQRRMQPGAVNIAPHIKAISDAGRELAAALKEKTDDKLKTLSPASRAPEAGGTIRERTAETARSQARLNHAFAKLEQEFDRLPQAIKHDFIDAIEHGRKQVDPALQPVADLIRKELDAKRDEVRALGTGALDDFIDNYFPHIWKDPGAAKTLMARIFGKRPLQGPKSFLKERKLPTVADGLAAGLELVTDNPVSFSLMKLHEMDRYIMGQKIFSELKDTGQVKFFGSPKQVPDNWDKIEDPIARVMELRPRTNVLGQPGAPERVLHGEYYAPEPVARVLNNYLSRGAHFATRGEDGLYHAVRSLYVQPLRGLGNTMNMAQLGLSAYHLTFTALDSAVSKAALGLEQISRGKPLQGAKSIASAPIAPITNMLQGSRVLREYFRPGSQGAEMAAIVDALQAGGGRARMGGFYGNNAMANFGKAFRQRQVGGMLRNFVGGAIETASYPIMQGVVPRMKMGVFADMARMELERLGPNASRADVRRVMGAAWDSVDNRMGQMTYDNLFWNNAVKDLLLTSVRSVGWNLGTFRELGGAVIDSATIMKRLRAGDPAITHRMAYAVAMPVMIGTAGAVYGYLNGHPPKEMYDYYHPMNAEGRRVDLPTYMKDIPKWGHQPFKTLQGKINPSLQTIFEMLSNKDFFGKDIANQDDGLVQQMAKGAVFFAEQYEPFSLRDKQGKHEQQAQGRERLEQFFGVMPHKEPSNVQWITVPKRSKSTVTNGEVKLKKPSPGGIR